MIASSPFVHSFKTKTGNLNRTEYWLISRFSTPCCCLIDAVVWCVFRFKYYYFSAYFSADLLPLNALALVYLCFASNFVCNVTIIVCAGKFLDRPLI